MRRDDGPATRDTLIWFGAFIVSGGLGDYFWGTWVAVPFFMVYGVLYGSRRQPLARVWPRTAFKTRWKNDAVYQIACFMMMREPGSGAGAIHATTPIRSSSAATRKSSATSARVCLCSIFLAQISSAAFDRSFPHATGRLDGGGDDFRARDRAVESVLCRADLGRIYAARDCRLPLVPSILPAMHIGLPTLYGGWFAAVFRPDAALGLAEDVLDHRLNSRTVYMNPIFRFLYWNMNYHVEHHMFPTGPLSCAAAAARGDQGGLPDALSELHRRLSRDHSGARAPAEGSDLFCPARAAADGAAWATAPGPAKSTGRLK